MNDKKNKIESINKILKENKFQINLFFKNGDIENRNLRSLKNIKEHLLPYGIF
jgi:hypothetical protein